MIYLLSWLTTSPLPTFYQRTHTWQLLPLCCLLRRSFRSLYASGREGKRLRRSRSLGISERREVLLQGFIVVVLVWEIVWILELIIFLGLNFAAIAFLPEGEIKVVTMEADPVTLTRRILGLLRPIHARVVLFKRSQERTHGRFFFFLFEL